MRARFGAGLLVACVALALAPACASRGPAAPSPLATPSPTARLTITSDAAVHRFRVAIADEPREQAQGLMGRTHLEEDEGMAFLFGRPVRTSFWMKDTLLPLSIAFWDETGRIVAIMDMDPCRRDPCPLHHPQVAYVGALEVTQGGFAERGIEVGDRVSLEGTP